MMISKKRAALTMTSLLAAAGATAFQAATGPTRVSAASPPHIMVIIDENAAHDATLGSPYIDGNPAAPYINNTLRPTYTEATNWFGVEHVSSFDYYDLISGADQKGMTKPYPGTTFVDQLAAKKISWKAYIESMPSTCYTGGGNGMYDPGHNPFIAFKSIVKNPAQCNNDVPATNMISDLNGATPPSFVWVTPNQCDDMHSKCAPTNNFVAQGDSWLNTTVPAVQSTQWYKNGGIIIVTWDESVTSDTTGVPGSTDSGGHIATLVISAAPHSQYLSAGDHFGTLRGLQNAYGVGCLAASCKSVHGDIGGAFNLTTGAIAGTVTDKTTTNPINGATVSCPTCPTTTATTLPDGSYTFSGVPPGSYTLSFSATGYTSQSGVPVSVTKGSTTTQNEALVPQPGTITGTVTDAQTHAAIGGATVSCPTCPTTTATTNPSGVYSFSSVPEGSYSLSFSASTYVPQNSVPVTVLPGSTTKQDEALAEMGSITGRVTDQTTGGTAPIQGAIVSCPSCATTTATTDINGMYSFSSAPVGTDNLSFSATGYVPVNNVPVTVTQGATSTQDEALAEQPGTIDGTVTDSRTSQPISGATVSCTCSGTPATTDATGFYMFSPVAEGSYTLNFSATGYTEQDNVPVSVTKGSTTTQNAALVSTAPPLIFSDDFESGNFSAWTSVSPSGMVVQSPIAHSPTHAAQGSASSSAAYARETLPSTYSSGYERVWFNVTSSSTQVYLLQASTAANARVASVYVSTAGLLGLQAADNSYHLSSTSVAANTWHELELRFTTGTAGSADVWLDGIDVIPLSSVNLKTTPVAVMQIGDQTSHTWNVFYDDAAFDTSQIP